MISAGLFAERDWPRCPKQHQIAKPQGSIEAEFKPWSRVEFQGISLTQEHRNLLHNLGFC